MTTSQYKQNTAVQIMAEDAPVKAPDTTIQGLLNIMASLRGPAGCPWDREQTFTSLLRYLVEESAEYMDAVESGDRTAMAEELGDVLLQVVFAAQIAEEEGSFSFQTVVDGIATKLWERHPHVFGDQAAAQNAADVERIWAEQKSKERAARGDDRDARIARNPLEAVPRSLEPLQRAFALGKAAAKVGFDWDNAHEVVPKVAEELEEVMDAAAQDDAEALEEEVGDLLFSVVNLARKLGVRPEAAMRRANRKFERRFAAIVDAVEADGSAVATAGRDAMEDAWERVRTADRARRQER